MTRARNSANLASHGNLFVDITNDRTGIGSVVPGQSLHVAGTAGFHADVTFTGDNAKNTFWDRSSGVLKFNDNAYVRLGTGNDMSIYHDGTNNIIAATVPKNLLLQSDDLQLQDCSNSHLYVKCVRDSYVRLYHDNVRKFQTEAYGVNVTGTTDTDGLVVSGVATVTTMNVTGVLTYDDVTSVDSVGIVTARQGIHIDDSIVHIGDTNTKIRFPAADTISFETSGAERVRIDSSGRLLVGRTTGNSANLLVQSGAQVFAGANSGNSSCLTMDYNTANGAGRIMGHASSGGMLQFLTNASGAGVTTKLTIDSTGTATFAGDVTVSGNLSVTGTTTQNNSVSTSQKTITLASGAANNAAVDGAGIVVDAGSDTDKTLKWLDSTDRWTFTGGDVSANAYYGDGSNLTGIAADRIFEGNTEAEVVDTGSDGHFKVTTEGSERLRIDSSGRLTVGATGVTNNGIAEFHRDIGGGAEGCHILVKNTSTNSVNNTARLKLETSGGTAQFYAFATGITELRSRVGGTADWKIRADGAASTRFFTNGNERVTIDSSGRLLINRTASRAIAGDNAKLQIENPSSGLLTLLRTSNDGDAAYLAIAKSRSASGTVCQSGDEIGRITFVPHDGTDLNHHAAEIRAYVDTGIGSNDTPGYLTFHTNAGTTTTTERLRITSDGKFGFGTNSPDQTVHIHKGSAGSVSSTATSVLTLENSTTAVLQFLTPNTVSAQLRFGDPQDDGVGFIDYSHSSNTMAFGVYGPTRMQLDSNGHLGIAVASTTQLANSKQLTLRPTDDDGIRLIRPGDANNSPNIHLDLTTTTSGSAFPSGEAYTTKYKTANIDQIFETAEGGGTGGNISFRTRSSSGESLRIDPNGDIQINQPSEASGRLTIKGTNSNGSTAWAVSDSGKAREGIDITCTTVGDGNFGGAISLACGGNGRSAIAAVQIGSDDDVNGLAFFTHGSNNGADNTEERMRILPNGRILVGTTVDASGGADSSYTGYNTTGDLILMSRANNSNALTLVNPTTIANNAALGTGCAGINFASRNYYTSHGKTGIHYQIIMGKGHSSYMDRGMLKFVPGYNGNQAYDGSGSTDDNSIQFTWYGGIKTRGVNFMVSAVYALSNSSEIISSGGRAQLQDTNARHFGPGTSTTNAFGFTDSRKRITFYKKGYVLCDFHQDFIGTTANGYAHWYVSKNGTNVGNQLIENSENSGEWSTITYTHCIPVSENDYLEVYFNGNHWTALDTSDWSFYRFVWYNDPEHTSGT